MASFSRRCFVVAGISLALATLGCGGSGLAPVSGKVVFSDNTPLTGGGNVVFTPDDGKLAAQGVLTPDGTFRLGTHTAGDGAMPGKYKAAIEPADDNIKKRTFDVRFQNPKTSGLEYTVVPGKNEFTLTVTKPGKKK